MLTQEDVLNALKTIIYPNFEKDIVSFGFVKNITLHDDQLGLLIEIPSSSEERRDFKGKYLQSDARKRRESFEFGY